MAVSVPGAPSAVSAALDALAKALQAEGGIDFAGLVLYGGLARGRFREGRSDVNVVVLLHHANRAVLDRIAAPLRAARRAALVEAMILTPAEVPAAAFEFPTKFLDIKRHHVMLAGVDPFATLEVPRVMVQLRIAQSLRNLLLRLRRRYALASDDAPALREILIEVARPLAIEMLALLYDGGHPVPESDQTAAVFDAAARAFGLDAEALADLAALRADSRKNGRLDAPASFGRVLDVIARLSDRADALAGAPE
jgi:hypothetical protein